MYGRDAVSMVAHEKFFRVESVIFRVLERLPGLLQPYSAVFIEGFPLLCSGCLPTRQMRGVSASWAGNDGQTIIAS